MDRMINITSRFGPCGQRDVHVPAGESDDDNDDDDDVPSGVHHRVAGRLPLLPGLPAHR